MRGAVNSLEPLKNIAAKHNTTPAAVTLSWIRSKGIMALPKSENKMRIRENFESLGLQLDLSDIAVIDSLNQNLRLGPPLAHFWR
jgi:2,5-diketo-D-gluconate reductase B